MKAAAIGDPTFITGFNLVGVEGFLAQTEDEVKQVLKEVLRKNQYALLILPERYVEATAEIRSRILKEREIIPMFSFIPDYTGISGKRVEELKKSVSLAVGAKLKL